MLWLWDPSHWVVAAENEVPVRKRHNYLQTIYMTRSGRASANLLNLDRFCWYSNKPPCSSWSISRQLSAVDSTNEHSRGAKQIRQSFQASSLCCSSLCIRGQRTGKWKSSAWKRSRGQYNVLSWCILHFTDHSVKCWLPVGTNKFPRVPILYG